MNTILERYNKNELEQGRSVSYFIREMFKPITFISTAVPCHINDESELTTMVDMWIHEPEDITNNLLSGLKEEEFDMLKNIATNVWDSTSDMIYQAAPKVGLLRQIYQRRLINDLFPEAKKILEMGPGSGYLSLMLALDKKKVYAMDVTQNLYLWQNFLFSNYNLLNELALDDINDDNNKITHIPWWKFIHADKIFNKLDLITVNHALCEMSNNSVRHLLTVAKNSGHPKFFMESYGSYSSSHKRSDISPLFREFGYKETYNKNDIHIFEYDNSEVTFKKSNILKLILFIPFIRHLIRFIYKELQLAKSILKMLFEIVISKFRRKKIINKYNYNDVLEFYKNLTGEKNYRTPCEEMFYDVCKPKISGIRAKLAYGKFDADF